MKIRSVSFLVILMVVMSSQAFAYFENLNLIQVIYDSTTTIEKGYDLGAIGGATIPIDNTGPVRTLTAVHTFQASDFNETSLANLRLGYVANGYDQITGVPNFFFATTRTTAPVTVGNGNTFQNGYTPLSSYYRNTLGGATSDDVTAATTNANSFAKRMDVTTANAGQYAGLNGGSSRAFGSVNLSALATVGYVDMYLYKFTRPLSTVTLDAGSIATSAYVGILRLSADGSTTLLAQTPPPVVPIPASFLLFGSGILGLFGLKRKEVLS